jgi:hypothetical protein
MKRLLLITLSSVAFGLLTLEANAQKEYTPSKGYMSFEGEMIFSFADISSPEGVNYDQNMRWSPVFNLAWHYNYDVADFFGLNAGLGIRNVGFIAKTDEQVGEDNIDRIKYRTYNAGIPIGFKLGRLDQDKPFFLFAGYEFELPFHYKQKEFSGSDKENKRTGWFSDRTTDFQQSAFVGIQFPQGFSLKAKYYLTEFFDSEYTETITSPDGDLIIRPYENFNANVFYFSICWFPFQDIDYALNKQYGN